MLRYQRSFLLFGQEEIRGDPEWVQGDKLLQYYRQDILIAGSAVVNRGDVRKVDAFKRHGIIKVGQT